MTTFFAGLDLGQAHDNIAFALLARPFDRGRNCYALRHLHRWQPGTLYPQIAEEVSRLLRAASCGGCRLVVDQTAVGRAVAQLFRLGDTVSTRQVLIRAGHAVTSGEDGCTHVPKKELVSVLQLLLQTQRLRIAAAMPLANALSREKAAFRASVKVADGAEELSWRERMHDELVLAVALAARGGRAPSAQRRHAVDLGRALGTGDRTWMVSMRTEVVAAGH